MGADWMYLATAVMVGVGFILLVLACAVADAVRLFGEIVLAPVVPAARRARDARLARRERERLAAGARTHKSLQDLRERAHAAEPWWKKPRNEWPDEH